MVHLVYTRFNLAIKFGDKRIPGGGLREDSDVPKKNPWLDESYLEKRFELFEKYTFNSFVCQSNKDFTWIVMFHKDTPMKYKRKIEQYQKIMPQFHPMYFDDKESENMSDIIKKDIQQHYEGCTVITTRVDNDDLVNTDFIKVIQQEVKNIDDEKEQFFLSCVNGLQYDVRNKQITRFSYPNNHFITMVTGLEKIGKHVLEFNHAYIDSAKIKILYKKTEKPLWVEIVHENNVSNLPHWRVKDILVSYSIGKEYECLELQWNNKRQYLFFMIRGIILAFWNRGKDLYRIINNKIMVK